MSIERQLRALVQRELDVRGLSLSTFARLCGIPASQLGAFLKGISGLPLDVLEGTVLRKLGKVPIVTAVDIPHSEERKSLRDQFTENLRAELAARGWSQSHFARVLGVSPAMVNKYIHGENVPGLAIVEKFSVALGLDPSGLIQRPKPI